MTEQKDVLKRALDAIDTLSARLAESEGRQRESIAVVGMACRFPGGVTNPAQYWSLLREGRSGIVEIPGDRWDVDAHYDPDPSAEGKMYTRHGGFLENIDGFDAPFFGIAPREAVTLDPQHRLLLECSWEALEDAGEAPDRLANSSTGVYIGITTSDYARILKESGNDTDVYSASGTALNAAAGRISFALGLQGPSMAIDTACSSSLVAAHVATQALRSRECDLALIGGVNVMASPDPFILFSRWGMIAAGPECRTFDSGASGFVRGEGCGVLVLKRLRDAVADGNRVLAVIRGSAVNQDGPSSGLSVPNGLAQAKVIRRALDNAGLTPADVDYVEAHGTGTIIGDPIEVEALGEVYGGTREGKGPLMLGSVKPSIGHLESAAGVAGLMKLVLTVHHGELPPQRNFAEPNPRVDWAELPIEVVRERQPWPAGRTTRIGAVSGFGFSGTNAHLVVESPPAPAEVPQPAGRTQLIPLSARTDVALREAARRLANALAGDDVPALADVARTLSRGRASLPYRAAVVGDDPTVVRASLEAFARDEAAPGLVSAHAPDRSAPRVAFLFTGQGAQYPGMGLELREGFSVFREAFDHCDAILAEQGGPRLLEILQSAAGGARIHDTGVTQPAIFALEYALTELFRSWGIVPAAVLGHSVGEFTAACVAGILPLEDALRLIAERGRLMQSLPAGGGMLAVAADAATARDAAAPYADRVSMAALNGPRDVVLSGELEALAAIAQTLKANGVDSKPLVVSHAFHSPLMEPILEPFARAAAGVSPSPARLPLVSNLSGTIDPAACASPEYWRRHLREPVAYEASIRHLVENDYRTFLEIGPRGVLSGMARRFLTSDELMWASTLRGRAGEVADVLEGLGVLFTAGARPDWERVLEGAGRRVSLPTYPFQRKRHWVQPKPEIEGARAGAEERPGDHPLLGRRVDSPAGPVHFLCTLDPQRRPVLREHRVAGSIVFPAAGYIEIAAAAGASVLGGPVRLQGGSFRSALVLNETVPAEVQLVVSREGAAGAGFEVFSRPAGGDGEWQSHAVGRISGVERALANFPVGARGGCVEPVDIDAYQTRMREVGLEYGPSFRALGSAWRGDGEAFGELRLPQGDPLAERLSVHPGLLDAAFHLIGLALPESTEERFYLPVGFEAVEIAGRVGSAARAHVALRVADEHQVIADVSVWRENGEPVLRVTGLQARPVTPAQFRTAIGGAARTELLRLDWRPAPDAPLRSAGEWLLLGGDEDVASTVGDALRSAGVAVTWLPPSAVGSAVERVLAGDGRTGIVDLRALGTSRPGDTASRSESNPAGAPSAAGRASLEGTLSLLRQFAITPPTAGVRLVLPTLHGQGAAPGDQVDPMASALWGLAATAAAEVPGLDARLLDLDRVDDAATAVISAALRDDAEDRLAVRSGELRTARLVPAATLASGDLDLPSGAYELVMAGRGTLEGLGVEPRARRTPGPGEVEIEVMASGLNFRDVLNLLDMYPGPAGPLGNECSGRVVALGAGVEGFQTGDLVACIADATFASHVIAQAALTFQVPAQLSVAQAAAFPIAQLTAYQALHRVGSMKAGDRVLVHAGAGGVGLAAVHLALAAGAEVYASAGSEEKRSYLRSLGVRDVFDSRHPATAADMLSVTGGEGFDLLLNSLTGSFIDEGLRALAPGGRFLEIGLREMRSPEAVAELREDVSYHSLLLGDLCREEPAAVREMYGALLELLEDGRIPAPRTHPFPVARSPEAFQFMAKARQIGRIAITHPAPALPLARSDAAYLVTGGLGALGLHVAEWLAAEGAGAVVLMGRSDPSEEAAVRIGRIEAAGTRVEVVRGDIAGADALDFLLDPTRLPLRGIIHAAGVTDDAALPWVDEERLERALRPKADGAVNLARLAKQVQPDFFVLFSSAAALLGSPGQAAYAAANGFLDGLAQRLRENGIPAVSIGWGAWEGSGMAAQVNERTEREWAVRGVRMLSVEEGLRLLGEAISSGLSRAAAIPMDWTRFLRSLGPGRAPALLRELAPDAAAPAEEPAEAPEAVSMREQIQSLAAHERMPVLVDRLRRETAAVMGIQRPNELEVATGLMEQGMDSLMAVELSGRLGRLLGVALPTTFAFEFPTLNALAGHLSRELGLTVETGSRVRSPEDGGVASMTAEEATRALLAELDQIGY